VVLSGPQGGAFIRTVVETLDSGVLKRVSKFPAGQAGLGRWHYASQSGVMVWFGQFPWFFSDRSG
jgi:hypothetical protein